MESAPHRRFLTLEEVRHELALSTEQLTSLIEDRRIVAIRLAGVWRVERCMLEQFVREAYEEARMLGRARSSGSPSVPSVEEGGGAAARRTGTDLPPQLLRVLQLIAGGMSNREIAEILSIEVSTVKSHVSALLSRLAVRDRENLIVYAWKAGLVRLED